MTDIQRVSVVLPSLDPDEKLTAVIDGLLRVGFTDIILVNDGSKPENLHYFEEAAAQHPEIKLLHHPENRGKGAALKTAFTYVLENRPDSMGVVTVDGDNQHHCEDTRSCALHMARTGKLVLGVRDFDQEDVPFKSRNGNKITSWVFKVFVGMTISDTQTGLRAIPVQYLKDLTAIYGDRFEYETNMLLAMQTHQIPFDEVKIRTVYIEVNKSSHFRAVRDSWRIYKLILAHFFRFTASSLLSSVIDEGLFVLLTWLLESSLSGLLLTAIPTVTARFLSSIVNFYMNQRIVFRTNAPTGKAMAKYFALAVPQLIAQLLITHGCYVLLGVGPEETLLRAVIYALVMVLLFIASFMIQQRWVFAPEKENQSKENQND